MRLGGGARKESLVISAMLIGCTETRLARCQNRSDEPAINLGFQLLDNNFRNMMARDEREKGREYVPWLEVCSLMSKLQSDNK